MADQRATRHRHVTEVALVNNLGTHLSVHIRATMSVDVARGAQYAGHVIHATEHGLVERILVQAHRCVTSPAGGG